MRWAFEEVDFEPAGKDHHSQGGSFDTARLVSKQIYGWEAPVSFRYDFIGTKGQPGKMSSSSGNVITLDDVLRVYTPEVARYLFAGTRPNTEFTISFDLDVIKIYEDYDKTERIASGLEKAKDEAAYRRERRIWELSQVECKSEAAPIQQVPFRHLCNLVQIHDGDIEETMASITPAPGLEQRAALKSRAERCKYWVENCAPEEFRFKLLDASDSANQPTEGLSGAERAGLRALRDTVAAHLDEYADDKACSTAVYAAAENAGLEPKALFRAAYQALIGKDQGPRLANFLRTIGKERVMAILAEY
jgi:lysyl-tRNA synthetase class 1